MGKGNSKRLRAFTWEDYGISKARYKELQGFCLQYKQKKKDSAKLSDYALAAAGCDTAGASHRMGAAAIRHYQRAEQAMRDCRMIEEAAMWAADAAGVRKTWKAILKNVTEGIGYDGLKALEELPFSGADFYGIRRAFFYRLDRLQYGEGEEGTEGGTGEEEGSG